MTSSPAHPAPKRRFVALIGEPDEWTLRTLGSVLTPNDFEVLEARSGREVLDQAGALRPDLVLVSAGLRDLTVEELLQRLQALASFSAITPVVITTHHGIEERDRIRHLRAGAWDTVQLPANAEELTLRLRRFAEAKVHADLAQGDGFLDSRTGLYSLQGILRRAEEETTEAWRHKRPLGCLVLGPGGAPDGEMDEDSLASRTQVLERQVAQFLRDASRRSDIVGRVTASEFIVVAPETDEGGAVTLAGRLLSGLDRLQPEDEEGSPPLSMCAGLFASTTPPSEALDAMELLSRATEALRRSQSASNGQARLVRWSLARESESSTEPANGATPMG